MAQSSEIKLLKRFDQNVEITGTLTVGGTSVSPSSYLTSIPSEYLTQTEGNSLYASQASYGVYGTGYGWVIRDYNGDANNLRIYYNDDDKTIRFYSRTNDQTGDAHIGLYHSGGWVTFGGDNINNWNTAYGWGNHASAGYLTSLPSHNHDGSYIKRLGDVTVTNFDTLPEGVLGSNETTATNQPYGNHHITLTLYNDASSGRRAQLFFGDSAEGGLWYRPRQGATIGWHPWQEIVTSNNISNYALTSYTETSTLDAVADRGRSTNQQLISTNPAGFRVDSGSYARIELDSTDDWSYVRLMDQGVVTWDIACYNSGDLEWRPGGGTANRMRLTTGGSLLVNEVWPQTSTNSARFSGAGDWGTKHYTNDGYIQLGPANTGHAHIYTDRPDFYFNKELYVNGGKVWHSGNDGSGSALDADRLDGEHGAYYAQASLSNNKTYTSGGNTAGSYLGGHYSSGGTEKPNSGTFGSGKLKIAMLRGGGSTTNLGFGGTWNDVLWISSYNGGDVKKSSALVFSKYDNTNVWLVKQNFDASDWGTGYLMWNSGNDGSGSGLDADLVDGLQASQFLRSDATDTATGMITFNAGTRFPDTNGTVQSMWGIYGWDTQLQFTKRNLSTDGFEGVAMYIDYGGLYVQSDYSFRSPIFYDSNDTNYYVNPNDTSRFNKVMTNNSGATPRYDTAFFVLQAQHWYGDTGSQIMYLGESGNPVRLRGTLRIGSNANADSSMKLTVAGSANATSDFRAPIFYDSDNTAYYLNPGGTSRLRAIGDESGGALHVMYPIGASYGSGSTTGAFKIKLPQSWTNTMMRMHVEIFNYSSNSSIDVYISGYNYAGGGGYWVNASAYIVAPNYVDANLTVRFGHDGTNCCVFIGETNTSWSYPKVVVKSFQAGHSQYDLAKWDDNWDVTVETSLPSNIDATFTNLQVGRYIDRLYDRDNNSYSLKPSSQSSLSTLAVGSTTVGDGVFSVRNGDMLIDRGREIRWNTGTGSGEYIYSKTSSPYDVTIHSGSHDALQCPNTGQVRINYLGAQKFVTTSSGVSITGSMTASGDVIAYSDERVKENVKTIDNALDKVNKLRGVEYNKIGEEKQNIGVIAQEVEKILPQVVTEDEEGMKGVAYGNIVGVLIEAIKEQQKQIDELKKLINP